MNDFDPDNELYGVYDIPAITESSAFSRANKKRREPQWSIKDLAEYAGVGIETIRRRLKIDDNRPSPSNLHGGNGAKYNKSELIAWHEQYIVNFRTLK